MSKTHFFLRLIAIAGSLFALILSALISRSVSKVALAGYEKFYPKEKPLPALTEFWINGIANSQTIVIFGIVLALIFGFAIWRVWRLPENSEWRTTGMIFVPSLAYITAFLIIGTTLIAVILPVVTTSFR